jgi:hypothetical protein
MDSAVRPVVRSLKEEEIWTAEYRKLEEALTSIARWVEECNGPREFTHCIFVVPCSTVLRERDRSAGNPIPRTPTRRVGGMVGRFASVQELLVQCRDFFRQDKGLEEIQFLRISRLATILRCAIWWFFSSICAYRKSHSAVFTHCNIVALRSKLATISIRRGTEYAQETAGKYVSPSRRGNFSEAENRRACQSHAAAGMLLTHLFSLGYARSGSYSCHRDDNF